MAVNFFELEEGGESAAKFRLLSGDSGFCTWRRLFSSDDDFNPKSEFKTVPACTADESCRELMSSSQQQFGFEYSQLGQHSNGGGDSSVLVGGNNWLVSGLDLAVLESSLSPCVPPAVDLFVSSPKLGGLGTAADWESSAIDS